MLKRVSVQGCLHLYQTKVSPYILSGISVLDNSRWFFNHFFLDQYFRQLKLFFVCVYYFCCEDGYMFLSIHFYNLEHSWNLENLVKTPDPSFLIQGKWSFSYCFARPAHGAWQHEWGLYLLSLCSQVWRR